MVDTDGQVVPLGTTGELMIRGYSVMLGYWNDEEKTSQTITPSHWYKTGYVHLSAECLFKAGKGGGSG